MRQEKAKNLLDTFLLPVLVIIMVRYLGVFLASFIWPVAYSLSLGFDLISLPFISFGSTENLGAINTFSWVFVLLIVGGAFGYILFRSIYHHESWMHPKRSGEIHQRNLDFLLISQTSAYSQINGWGLCSLGLIALLVGDFSQRAINPVMLGVSVTILFGLFITGLLNLSKMKSLNGQ
jgi:hypothetical protein